MGSNAAGTSATPPPFFRDQPRIQTILKAIHESPPRLADKGPEYAFAVVALLLVFGLFLGFAIPMIISVLTE